jgi:hypothetical protein
VLLREYIKSRQKTTKFWTKTRINGHPPKGMAVLPMQMDLWGAEYMVYMLYIQEVETMKHLGEAVEGCCA